MSDSINSEPRIAVVVGATGLVGQALVRLLLNSNEYNEVITLGRRKLDGGHPKLSQYVVNFEQAETWQALLQGTDLFCCLGTTLKQAGSKQAQKQIDLELPSKIATQAMNNGIQRCVLISSLGANKPRGSFYLNLKHQLEQDYSALPFQQLDIIRPSLLLGNRKELRVGELIGSYILPLLCLIPGLTRFRPIRANQVAQAMKHLNLLHHSSIKITENKALHEHAKFK